MFGVELLLAETIRLLQNRYWRTSLSDQYEINLAINNSWFQVSEI